ncbi:MAG: MinD/ParA family protein [Pseudomonadota bacterium]|nr:MAG: MinD/ParA family protein [Pseudomonadota bacterium]
MSNHLHGDSRDDQGPLSASARVIAVASGKGGVGKTNVVTNLAIAVAARGHRVCIVDADSGMANINILLGFSPKYGLAEVLSGEIGLSEALFKGPQGVQVLAGASGLAGMATLDDAQRHRLMGVLSKLERLFDVIFVDLAAGADTTVTDLLRAAHHRLVVVTPDPTSLTNAYSLLKILENKEVGLGVGLVVNQATDADNGVATYQRLKKVCDLFLKNAMTYLGYVCSDPTITTSVRLRRPVVLLKHDAPASRCFYQLAQTLIDLIAQPAASRRSFSAQWETPACPAPPVPAAIPPEVPAVTEPPAIAAVLPEAGEPTTAALDHPPPLPPCPASEEVQAVDEMIAPLPDRDALLEQLAKEMSGGEMSEHEAGMVVLSLLSACLNGFGRYPVDIRALVNAAINRRELSADALRHLASQLQQTYRDRFGHELYPVDTTPPRQASNR